MAVSLVSAPLTLRIPVRFGPRLFWRQRVAPSRRHPLPAPTAGVMAAAPAPQPSDSGAWTTEEQNYLRALREAGL